ncbi:hypothetical protein EJB05_03131, partial [Eragrostis curvula]
GPSSELVLHVAAGDRNTPLPPPPLPSPTPSHHSRRLELAARRRQAAPGRAAPPQALQDFPQAHQGHRFPYHVAKLAIEPVFPNSGHGLTLTATTNFSLSAYEVIQEQLEDQDAEQFRRRYQLTLA